MTPPPPERLQAVQRLSAELARLAMGEGSENELFQAVLERLKVATGALGGVVWRVVQRGEKGFHFHPEAALELEGAAGEEGSDQRQQVLRAANEVTLSSQPLVLMPTPPTQQTVTPGVLVNLGPHAIVAAALRSGDDALGAVQLWFPARSEPKQLAEVALLVQALLQELGPRLRSRHLRELGTQSQRQQRLLQMAADLAGETELDAVAKLAAAHARELLGINRVSLLIRRGGVWRVLAVSGQEVPDARSRLLSAMRKLVAVHFKEVPWVLCGTAAEGEDSVLTDAHMRSAALIPLRPGREGSIYGCLLAESVEPAAFGTPGAAGESRAPLLVLAQWLADLTGRSLHTALVRQAMPLGGPLQKIALWRVGSPLPHTRRRWLKVGLFCLLLLASALWPMQVRVDGDCTLLPLHRAYITAEAPGRIETVLVRAGQRVEQGQELARLDTQRLRSELESARQARLRLEAEAGRQRGQGKEALARIATLEAQAQAEQERRLELEISLAVLRSPLEGVVMTPDVHLKIGSFLQAGEAFAEVAAVASWDLRLSLPEAELAVLEAALKEGPVPVRCLLYTQSAREFPATISDAGQISPVLEAGSEGGIFQVTLPGVEMPTELAPLLRPGLTGRVRISLERQPAGIVLLREFTRWLRMRWWI